jgi:transcriptional regulator with XRE-family HTH domain
LRKIKKVSIPETPSNLGEHIRKKRMEEGMYQTDVARLLNVAPDSITYWENNRFQPQVQYYPRIIEFLGYFPFQLDTSLFENKIKAYRYINGLSQKSFAKLMNVDPATVSRWEEGKGQIEKKKEVESMLSNCGFLESITQTIL